MRSLNSLYGSRQYQRWLYLCTVVMLMEIITTTVLLFDLDKSWIFHVSIASPIVSMVGICCAIFLMWISKNLYKKKLIIIYGIIALSSVIAITLEISVNSEIKFTDKIFTIILIGLIKYNTIQDCKRIGYLPRLQFGVLTAASILFVLTIAEILVPMEMAIIDLLKLSVPLFLTFFNIHLIIPFNKMSRTNIGYTFMSPLAQCLMPMRIPERVDPCPGVWQSPRSRFCGAGWPVL